MELIVVEHTDKSKLIKLINGNNEVLIRVRYVSTVPEYQAQKLFHNGVEYDRWKPHGGFDKLLKKCLAWTFEGKRMDFLEKLYNGRY